MLRNLDEVPNAVINRWIESILMFHFTLVHIPGERHAPDGLSRRSFQPGDEEYLNPEDEYGPPNEDPWEFVNETEDEVEDIADFKDRIDTRHGYVTIERAVHNFHEDKVMQEAVERGETYSVCYNAGPLLPDVAEYSNIANYDEERRSSVMPAAWLPM